MGFYNRSEEAVYSETPETDLWRRIRAYSVVEDACDLVARRANKSACDPRIGAEVAASIEQANEYFKAAQAISMDTLPVHLYYGTVSLLRAALAVHRSAIPEIDSHGMSHRRNQGDSNVLSGNRAVIRASMSGGFAAYSSMTADSVVIGGSEVSLLGALALIPEVRPEFVRATGHPHLAVPVTRTVRADRSVLDIVRAEDLPSDLDTWLSEEDIKSNYLKPNLGPTGDLALRSVLATRPDPTVRSISGRRFLLRGLSTSKGVARAGVLVAHHLALFILSSISRYHPATWRDFARSAGRQRFLVQEFLTVSARVVPNLILNLLEDREIIFNPVRARDLQPPDALTKEQVQQLIRSELGR